MPPHDILGICLPEDMVGWRHGRRVSAAATAACSPALLLPLLPVPPFSTAAAAATLFCCGCYYFLLLLLPPFSAAAALFCCTLHCHLSPPPLGWASMQQNPSHCCHHTEIRTTFLMRKQQLGRAAWKSSLEEQDLHQKTPLQCLPLLLALCWFSWHGTPADA